ncbi:MAG: hypothetical protein J6D21_02795 [Clostridia bacterium]|nr:hypothetical protein [Clostridia bacterium]
MQKRTANKLWLAGVSAAACIAAILGGLSLGYAFDFSIGHFDTRSPLWILTLVIGWAAALGALLYPILALRRDNYAPDYKISPLLDFASLFAAFALVLDAVMTFLANRTAMDKVLYVRLLLTLIAAGFFVMLFLCRGEKSPLLSILGGGATLWATVEAFCAYFNDSVTLVSPFRYFPSIATVTLAYLLFCEVKHSYKEAKPLLLILFGAVSGALCLSVGGATVIAYLFNLNREAIFVTDGLWMVALGIYGLGRTKQVLFPKK